MPEKFLILGASSFYGRNFARLVQEKNQWSVELSRPDWELGRPLQDADYIVNFVSLNRVPESWDKPGSYIHTNVVLFQRLLEQLRLREFKRFIHVSTPEVYGSTKGWVTEGFPFNPSTPYAVTRAAGDMMLQAYSQAYGLPAIITRTANIYGPGQQDYRLIPKAFECKRRGEPLPLDGNGDSIRSFIHVRDACEGLYIAATKGTLGETYHISTENTVRIRSLVDMIGCRCESAPERLGKDFNYAMDSSKLRALGWSDHISLTDGLKEYEHSTAQVA